MAVPTPSALPNVLIKELTFSDGHSSHSAGGFRHHLSPSHAAGRQPVLAVDEAHLLPPRLLQELRFLLNYQLDSTAPVALVLCGHTELRHKLALRPLDAMRQRVTVAYHLPPLTAAEAGPYVTHQLQQVGVDRPVFTDHALQTGWEWSRGLPRRLNTWARACLMAAYAAQTTLVDDAVTTTAATELQWAGTV